MGLHKMSIHKHFINRKAFSLVEILVVMGMMSIIVSATLFFTLNQYQSTQFQSQRISIIRVLQSARAQSMNNIDGTNHGVAFMHQGYVLFTGTNLVSSSVEKDIYYPLDYGLEWGVDTPAEIVFTQLSGESTFDGKIKLINTALQKDEEIVINYAGKIGW